MANETLSIQKDDARLTVIGKSKADVYINSGLGIDLGDLDIGSLDPFDLNWQTDVPDPDNLPDAIQIITPPTKNTYTKGQKIDLNGAIVGAYKNGSIWTSTKYPNGHIPLNELIISPLMVTSEDTGEKCILSGTYDIGTESNPFVLQGVIPINEYTDLKKGSPSSDGEETIFTSLYDAAILYFFYLDTETRNFTCIWLISGKWRTLYHIKYFNPTTGYIWQDNDVVVSLSSTYEKDGKRVYYASGFTTGNIGQDGFVTLNCDSGYINEQITYSKLNTEKPFVAWELIYSSRTKNNSIKVEWKRPADEKILSTSFDISILKSENEEE